MVCPPPFTLFLFPNRFTFLGVDLFQPQPWPPKDDPDVRKLFLGHGSQAEGHPRARARRSRCCSCSKGPFRRGWGRWVGGWVEFMSVLCFAFLFRLSLFLFVPSFFLSFRFCLLFLSFSLSLFLSFSLSFFLSFFLSLFLSFSLSLFLSLSLLSHFHIVGPEVNPRDFAPVVIG